jgi:hypothetical protein
VAEGTLIVFDVHQSSEAFTLSQQGKRKTGTHCLIESCGILAPLACFMSWSRLARNSAKHPSIRYA